VKSTRDNKQRRKDTRILAKKLRKSGRIVSVGADINDFVEQLDGALGNAAERVETTDTSIESFIGEMKKITDDGDTLIATAEQARENASEAAETFDEVSDHFRMLFEALTGTLNSIQEAETFSAETKREFERFSKAVAKADSLLDRLRRIAESADVAVLNASLEADRSEIKPVSAEVITAAVRKSVQRFVSSVDYLTALVSGMKASIDTAQTAHGESTERIRTVTVLAKSIKGVFDDLSGALGSLDDGMNNLAFGVDETTPLCSGLKPSISALSDCADLCRSGMISIFAARAGRNNNEEYNVEDPVKALSLALEYLANQRPGAVDDVFSAADEIKYPVEELRRPLEEEASLIDDLSAVLGGAELTANNILETCQALSEKVETVSTATGGFEEGLTSFRTGIADSNDVLAELSRELTALLENRSAIGTNIGKLHDVLLKISRFDSVCAELTARLEVVAVTARLEALHSGGDGEALTAFAGEIEDAAGEAEKCRGEITALLDSLGEGYASVQERINAETWDQASDAVQTLIEYLEELNESGVRDIADEISVVSDILALQQKNIDAAWDITTTILGAVLAATASAAEASEGIKRAGNILGGITEKADILCTLAEEIDDGDISTEKGGKHE